MGNIIFSGQLPFCANMSWGFWENNSKCIGVAQCLDINFIQSIAEVRCTTGCTFLTKSLNRVWSSGDNFLPSFCKAISFLRNSESSTASISTFVVDSWNALRMSPLSYCLVWSAVPSLVAPW